MTLTLKVNLRVIHINIPTKCHDPKLNCCWDLIFGLVSFGPIIDRRADRRKAMYMSPPCIRTGGLKNVKCILSPTLLTSYCPCLHQIRKNIWDPGIWVHSLQFGYFRIRGHPLGYPKIRCSVIKRWIKSQNKTNNIPCLIYNKICNSRSNKKYTLAPGHYLLFLYKVQIVE